MKVRRVDFSPDEWIAGTIDLSLSERGMYITACSLIYSRGGQIALGVLRSFCREDLRTYNRCLARLIELGKLMLKEGYLSNKRCLSELENAEKRSVSAAENVAKRWSKIKKNNDLTDTPVLPDGNANHQPSTINHQKEVVGSLRSPTARASSDPHFAEWYAKYPHKVGRALAEKAYRSARVRASPGILIEGLLRYILSKPADRSWCGPAVWLNQDRWLDEPAENDGRVGDGRQSGVSNLFEGAFRAVEKLERAERDAADRGADRPAVVPLLDGRRSG